MGLFISMLKVSLLIVLLLSAGCEPTKEKESRKVIDEKVKRLAELQIKRENRIKQLKAMDAVQLARELEKESEKGVEPFNSMAFTEIVSRGQDTGSKLMPLLTQPDSRSLLGLLALQKIAPTQYRSLDSAFRIRVLTDALKTSKYFNKWGLPHLYWEDAAKVLIEEGKAAEESLIALLRDKREAPMWGSDEVVEYNKYKYRVCDYAWAMLNEIRDKKGEIPTDPAERDKLIEMVSK